MSRDGNGEGRGGEGIDIPIPILDTLLISPYPPHPLQNHLRGEDGDPQIIKRDPEGHPIRE